jgi:hypothetical protein
MFPRKIKTFSTRNQLLVQCGVFVSVCSLKWAALKVSAAQESHTLPIVDWRIFAFCPKAIAPFPFFSNTKNQCHLVPNSGIFLSVWYVQSTEIVVKY